MDWLSLFDSVIEFGKPWLTDAGFLRIKGIASVVGTMEYFAGDIGGARIEMVPAETLRDSAEDLKHTVVTLEHPKTPTGLLDPSTVSQFNVGEVIDAIFDEETGELEVELEIRDEAAIEAVIQRHVTGLSPGYKRTRIPAAPGAGFDFIQCKRRHNHLALCKAPRAETTIHLDSAGNAIFQPLSEDSMNPEEIKALIEAMFGDRLAATDSAIKEIRESLDALPVVEDPPDPPDEDPPVDFLVQYEAHARALAVADTLGVKVDKATDSTGDIRQKVVESYVNDEDFNIDSAKPGYIDGIFAVAAIAADAKSIEQKGKTDLDVLSDAFKRRESNLDALPNDDIPVVDPTQLSLGRGPKNKE